MTTAPDPTDPSRVTYTSDEVARGYRALRESAGVLVLPRDVVRASGPDVVTYLQGQCSQDLEALGLGDTADSLLLSPQGKVEVYFRATRTAEDAFVLDTDHGFGPVMTARLERFRLRTKVDVVPLDWACVAVLGPEAGQAVVGTPELVVPVDFGGIVGRHLLGSLPPVGLDAWVSDRVMRVPWASWEAVRIEAGLPVNGRELGEGTIAAEVGLVGRTVSFTKGCFTGQELVARLDSRGSKVARQLRAVVVGPADSVAVGPAAVTTLCGSPVSTADGGHEVGVVSSAAWSPALGRPVALATLHRRVEPPEPVTVAWSAPGGPVHQLAAEARILPLDVP